MQSKTTTGTPLKLIGVAAGGCASINIASAFWTLMARPGSNSDFHGPWSFVRFARRHAPELYQAAPLMAFQQHLYPGFRSFFPYQYPPSFLLPIFWLAHFRFEAAAMIWSLAGIAGLTAAAFGFFKPNFRCFALAALLASPASLLNAGTGETGYFTTALLLAGFALLPKRPLRAGMAFGFLTLKPQLGLLIPIALAARGDGRAMIAAVTTALALVALSCAIYPPGLWLNWLHVMPVYQSEYLAAGGPGLNAVVTVAGNLTALGASPRLAWILQTLASICTAGLVFWAFRRATYRQAVAALFAGTFLCAPHAFAYDTLPLVAAILLVLSENATSFTPAAAVLCVAAWLAPCLLLTSASCWFLYTIPETLLFLTIIYLAIGPSQRPNHCHESIPSTESRAGQV